VNLGAFPAHAAVAEPGPALLTALIGILLLAAWSLFGKYLLGPLRKSRSLRARVRAEDALKHIYQTGTHGISPTMQSIAGSMGVNLDCAAETLSQLQQGGLLEMNGAEPRLTSSGERYALSVIRAHRLWEQHLAEKTGLAQSEWHRQAEHKEHFITPEQADYLAAGLGHPLHDPHGDPIPDSDGEFIAAPGYPLPSLPAGNWARVLHVEDEPQQFYEQICAVGLHPGMVLRLLESTAQGVRFLCDGEEHLLAAIVAGNISVTPIRNLQPAEEPAEALLSHLSPGGFARVVRISRRCRGAERRRLMDLGVLPGTIVSSEFRSPAGQLTAYRVRDALIALRQDQAAMVQVAPADSRP
jgi:DtxR family transcriptional regulator, Mn-dependent transcriptional regulator